MAITPRSDCARDATPARTSSSNTAPAYAVHVRVGSVGHNVGKGRPRRCPRPHRAATGRVHKASPAYGGTPPPIRRAWSPARRANQQGHTTRRVPTPTRLPTLGRSPHRHAERRPTPRAVSRVSTCAQCRTRNRQVARARTDPGEGRGRDARITIGPRCHPAVPSPPLITRRAHAASISVPRYIAGLTRLARRGTHGTGHARTADRQQPAPSSATTSSRRHQPARCARPR
jgi:hypothetical protein